MHKEKYEELFNDVIGQNMAISLLDLSLKKKHIAPAYIFKGPNGVGRSLTARRFLEGLINNGIASIRERNRIKTLNHPDLLWIEPNYSHQGKLIPKSIVKNESLQLRGTPQVRLEQIREVKTFLGKKPIEANLGMVVIEEAEMMNEAASNALLKTLEEPENGLIILIAERPENLLQTIRSRCLEIPFSRMKTNDIRIIFSKISLEKEYIFPNEYDQQEIINLSNGSPGSLLENIKIWESLPDEVQSNLHNLPEHPIQALSIANNLTETLDIEQQVWIINWLEQHLWSQTHNAKPLQILRTLRSQLTGYVQPRLAWEIALLKLIK